MAEVPSVPSLRNLVASSVMTKSSRRNSSDNPIKRNFSTKSFSKYDTNTKEEPPIRKCETVIALSGNINHAIVWKKVKQTAKKINWGNRDSIFLLYIVRPILDDFSKIMQCFDLKNPRKCSKIEKNGV